MTVYLLLNCSLFFASIQIHLLYHIFQASVKVSPNGMSCAVWTKWREIMRARKPWAALEQFVGMPHMKVCRTKKRYFSVLHTQMRDAHLDQIPGHLEQKNVKQRHQVSISFLNISFIVCSTPRAIPSTSMPPSPFAPSPTTKRSCRWVLFSMSAPEGALFTGHSPE